MWTLLLIFHGMHGWPVPIALPGFFSENLCAQAAEKILTEENDAQRYYCIKNK